MQRTNTRTSPIVLVVDDFEKNRVAYVEHLQLAGFRTIETDNGRGAVDAALIHAPDVIILDFSLPSMDGWEATRRLKSDGRTRHIPIIALTGDGLKGNEAQAIDAGCNAFLRKPCRLDDLVTHVRAMLR